VAGKGAEHDPVGVVVKAVMLASGLLGMLPGLRRRRAAGPRPPATGHPVYGAHYRFSEDTRGWRHDGSQRIEALCPDGVWRAFLWTTNAESPWRPNGMRSYSFRKSDAEVARWLSDKFVGPPHLPRGGGGEAMSEEGVRSSSQVGVWVLDPYDAEAHERAGYPFHGEGWPNYSAPPRPSGERLEDIRLLPCYETCRGQDHRRDILRCADMHGGAEGRHSVLRCRVCAVLLAVAAVLTVAVGADRFAPIIRNLHTDMFKGHKLGVPGQPELAIVYSGGAYSTTIKALDEAVENPSVKAIVLRVKNSLGAEMLASETMCDMWDAVRRAGQKKPLVVSVDDVAASGYVAEPASTHDCGFDRVPAN
jgi:hypothetical protein